MSTRRSDRSFFGRVPWWTLFALVAAVALVIGSGVLSSSPPTSAQRAAAIEADLRCPSCEDLSVAQSDAATAVAVRATVIHQVDEGRTNQQIEAYLAARYGASIELEPPASGWALLVWLLPLVVAAGGILAVGAVLVRRHAATSRSIDGETAEKVAEDVDDDPTRDEERRVFLTRSLADADVEYMAGDLTDRDYLALRRRDMRRLAALETRRPAAANALPGSSAAAVAVAAAVAERPRPVDGVSQVVDGVGPTATSASSPPSGSADGRIRSRRSWWFLVGAILAFTAALVVAVTQFSSSRLPGQTPTGSVALSPAQQTTETLAQAATDVNEGKVDQAASLYQTVLDKHPYNEPALAQLGWIEFESGHLSGDQTLLSNARSKLDRAVQLDPKDYAARLYLGTFLLEEESNPSAAVAEFQRFFADDPPPALVSQAAPIIRQAYTSAGDPLPPGLPSSSS